MGYCKTTNLPHNTNSQKDLLHSQRISLDKSTNYTGHLAFYYDLKAPPHKSKKTGSKKNTLVFTQNSFLARIKSAKTTHLYIYELSNSTGKSRIPECTGVISVLLLGIRFVAPMLNYSIADEISLQLSLMSDLLATPFGPYLDFSVLR